MNSFNTAIIIATSLIYLHCGQIVAQESAQWKGSCEVTFSGKSTLHNFSGTVKTEAFTVAISNLSQMNTAKVSSQVKAKATKMNTKNKKRDAKMHDILQVSVFPDIIVDLTHLMISDTKPVMKGTMPRPTVIPFSLSIKGKKQSITGKVSDWLYSDQLITCSVSFPVSLKSSDLVVPTALGFIKVKDEIIIVAKLTLKKS